MADAALRARRLALTVGAVAVVSACSGAAGSAPAGPTAAATPTPSSAPVTSPAGAAAAAVAVPYLPSVDPAEFTAVVDNPYFPLRPGMRWEYRSRGGDGVEETVVAVTTATRTIRGVACVQVRDTVRLDGDVIEDTLDWYAQDRSGSVWYFGEETKEYDRGKVTSTSGSWEAGVDGAQPGIVMPGEPRVGDRYRQEYLRGEAEDIGEILSVGERADVPSGAYGDVVMTKDTTPLEPQMLERKYYASGVGPVLTVDVGSGGIRDELVRFAG